MQLETIDIPTSLLTALINPTQYSNQEANKGADLGAHFFQILQYNVVIGGVGRRGVRDKH